MLSLTIKGTEFFDELTEEFISHGDINVEFEHSLVSLSKWESKYEKPFLGKEDKTTDQVLDYVGMMILGDYSPEERKDIVSKLSDENVEKIQEYIGSKQSATWFNEPKNAPKSLEVITSELLYFWMINHNVPFQCETWHINRLITLIKVCNVKSAKPKKMSKAELAARNRELNAQRRAQYQTKG